MIPQLPQSFHNKTEEPCADLSGGVIEGDTSYHGLQILPEAK